MSAWFQDTGVLGLVAGVLALLSGILIAYVGRSILRPLKLLARMAAVIADGDFSVPIPFTSRRGAFGQLARTLDTLKAHVEAWHRESRTQRDRAQAAELRLLELESAFQNLGHGLAVINRELEVTFCNRRLGQLLDLPESLTSGPISFDALVRHTAERDDNAGQGVEEQIRQWRLFAKQSRRHRTTLQQSDGTVLEVRIEPQAEGGFVISFTDLDDSLPHDAAPERAGATKPPAIASVSETGGGAPSEAKSPGPALRVLLAEADKASQLLAITMLGKAGHWVDVASSGHDAIAAVTGRRYDVALIDMFLPDMEPGQAISEIRSLDGQEAATPIIAMCQSPQPELLAMCRRCGVEDVLPKPLEPDALNAGLSTALRSGGRCREEIRPDSPATGTCPDADARGKANPRVDLPLAG